MSANSVITSFIIGPNYALSGGQIGSEKTKISLKSKLNTPDCSSL